jgi:hypothetical protein
VQLVDEHEPLAVRRPVRVLVDALGVRDVDLVRAVGVHHINLEIAGSVGQERDLAAVR